MTVTLEERIDMLVADCLAYEQVIGALLRRLSEGERAEVLRNCREVIDAVAAHPDATRRGHRTFHQAYQALDRLFGPPTDPGPRSGL